MSPPVMRLKVTPVPTVRGKMDVRFPANVTGAGGIEVVKENGNYTIQPEDGPLGNVTGPGQGASVAGEFAVFTDGNNIEGSGTTIDDIGVTLERFGGNPAAADNMAAVRLAVAYCNARGITKITVNDNYACTTYSNDDQASLADITFVGNGSLTGVYRKRVIPENSPADTLQSIDFVPERHATQLARAAAPVVVLMGDSISTNLANTLGRQDMLTEVLASTIQNQFPNKTVEFVNRAINGATFDIYANVPAEAVTWRTDGSTTWIEYVEALAPDMVILSFGMNDGSLISLAAMDALIAEIESWTKVPDIVFCTNLTPSLAWEGESVRSVQEARDLAAGCIRTYAKFYDYGLIDLHRKHCMVRDGFDPVSSVLHNYDDGAQISPVLNVITATHEVYNYKGYVTFDPTTLSGGSIVCKIGTGNADFLLIGESGGFYTLAAFGGEFGDSVAISGPITSVTVPGSSSDAFTWEVFGNRLIVYHDVGDDQFGTYIDPLWSTNIIRRGGLFTPTISMTGSVSLTSGLFYYGAPRVNRPSRTNSQLWNNSDDPGDVGGSAGNHPSHEMAALVYRPVIEGTRFASRAGVPGTDVMAYDADLAAIAALSTTTYGRALLALADAAAARSVLALGSAATHNAGYLVFALSGVDFNSANTDNEIAITLPAGFTRYAINNIRITGASGSLTTATFGVFTAPSAGGLAVVASGTAITVNTGADATATATQSGTLTTNAMTFSVASYPSLYFRVQNPQGVAATANVTVVIQILP